MQSSRLVYGINLLEKSNNVKTDNVNENQSLSSNSEINEDMNSNSNKPIIINKVTDIDIRIAKLYSTCIESKYTRIVKVKKITPMTCKLQEIHVDLLRLHDLLSLSGRNYVTLFLDEFTQKSWVLLLRFKDKFFDIFKIWLL